MEGRTVSVGDKVLRTPRTFSKPGRKTDGYERTQMKGTVVYVHPKGRFHLVEFAEGLKECFRGARYEDTYQWDHERESAVRDDSEDHV